MSREKPTEEVKINKTVDRETRSEQEQAQQEVNKVSVKNLEAWFGTKQALKNINLDVRENCYSIYWTFRLW